MQVALFTRAWIEILRVHTRTTTKQVALFTRAWIEMALQKSIQAHWNKVALFTRAWIEIYSISGVSMSFDVALFTRAWIEITALFCVRMQAMSRPLHEGVD